MRVRWRTLYQEWVPRSRPSTSPCATSILRRTGQCAASPRRSTRPTKTSTSTGAMSSLLSEGRRSSCARTAQRIAIGPLAGNPFPDANLAFFYAIARRSRWAGCARSRSMRRSGARKADVIRRGVSLGVPFELTLSCMQPAEAAALRPLQQVSRAARRIPRGWRRRSHLVRRCAGSLILAGDSHPAALHHRDAETRRSLGGGHIRSLVQITEDRQVTYRTERNPKFSVSLCLCGAPEVRVRSASAAVAPIERDSGCRSYCLRNGSSYEK